MIEGRYVQAIVAAVLVLAAITEAETNDIPDRIGQADFRPRQNLGGPTSVGAQLEEDDQLVEPAFRFERIDAFLQPWFDAKGRLDERTGFQLGTTYTTVFMGASKTLPGNEDAAASGIFRVFGRWALIGRDTPHEGTLVFSVDNRHRLGSDVPPADLGFETGYLGIPAVLFNDLGWLLVDIHWQQIFRGGKTGLILGRYDPNDYLDVLGCANPWTTFLNLAIGFNTSIALPDSMFGVGGGHWFTDQLYVGATLNDANGTVSEVGAFEDGTEFYKAVETGWAPSRAERYFKKFHVMGWHVDPRENAGIPEAWGFTAGANWTFNKRLMPFLKIGASDGEVQLANASISTGAIYKFFKTSDLVGLGLNWSEPAGQTIRDDDQYTGELFYRFQFGQNLAITPSVQLIVNPANNPADDTIWIGGLRLRLAL